MNTGLRRLMNIVQAEFSATGFAPNEEVREIIDRWQMLPPRVDAASTTLAEDGGTVPIDVPSEQLLRRALARLDSELALLFSRDGSLKSREAFKPFRDFVLFALVCVTGSRESALFAGPDGPILVGDYDPHHAFRGTDYIGPALRIRPARKGPNRKRRGPEGRRVPERMWLPLPAEVARALEIYLDIVGTRNNPDAPLWISEWLDRAHRVPNLEKPLDARAFDYIVEKALDPAFVKGGGQFTPHSIRHVIEPLAAAIGDSLIRGEFELGEGMPVLTQTERGDLRGQVFADALTGHVFHDDPNGYKGRERNRERFALMAGFGVWERLTGPSGAEMGPDHERRARADRTLATLRTELAASSDYASLLSAELHATARRARRSGLDQEQMNQLHADRWELEDRVRAESQRLDDLKTSIRNAEADVAAAYEARVPLPTDWLPDRGPDDPIRLKEAAVRARVTIGYLRDLAHLGRLECRRDGRYHVTTLRALAAAGLSVEVDEPTTPVDEPTPQVVDDAPAELELGARLPLAQAPQVFNISRETAKRWSRGLMPHAAGDPRNPWQPNPDPSKPPECIQGEIGAKRKWIVVTPALLRWLHLNPVIKRRFTLALAGRL
jgi:hypothetical protein